MIDGIVNALIGGALIGVAASMMLVFNGRVTGISGILSGFLNLIKGDRLWRGSFLAGLFAGGAILVAFYGQAFVNTSERSLGALVGAGLLVGFGTVMGSGCTSGHGVCGIARLSKRSLMATVLFMAAGFLMANLVQILFGGQL